MKHMGVMLGVGVVVLGGIGAVFVMDRFPQDVPPEVDILGGEVVNELATLEAPQRTLNTDVNDVYKVTVSTRRAIGSPGGDRLVQLQPHPRRRPLFPSDRDHHGEYREVEGPLQL